MTEREQFELHEDARPVDPLIGRVLGGRFDIRHPIGEGGMGRVYLAIQQPLGRKVAVKVLHPTLPSSHDPHFQRRFLQEAALTARLHHPNTVTVLDYGQTDDGVYYLAMEYLEGKTLAQELQTGGPLPWQRAVDIAQQLCRSLKEAHAQGVVHRDLKPANIMLCSDGERDLAKVLDFGLVKTMAPDGAAPESTEITQRGTFIGSPQYMSPEQARNESDARSDIYSLGVLLYHMLMGRPPFVSGDYIELLFAHHRQPPPQFRHLRPDLDVPHPLEAVVRRCLEKKPEARFQSMEELLEALRQASVGAGLNSGIFRQPLGMPTGSNSGVFRQPVTPSAPLFSAVTGRKDGEAPAAADAPEEGGERTRAYSLAADLGVVLPEKVKAQQSPGRRMGLVGLMGGVLLLAGVGAVSLVRRPAASEAPAQAPAAAPAAPEAAAEARGNLVRFRVMSEPAGARVLLQGVEKGRTPFVLEMPPDENGIATVELTLVKEGYQPETVLTGGSGEVVLMQRMQKRTVQRRNERSGWSARTSPEREVAPAPAAAPAVAQQEARAPTAAVAAPAAMLGTAPLPTGVETALQTPHASGRAVDVLPFGEGMEPPIKLAGPTPVYSREALAAGVEGTMVVKCTISAEGRVSDCRVLKSLPFMEESVLRSLAASRYRPVTFNGTPVAVDYVFNVRIMAARR